MSELDQPVESNAKAFTDLARSGHAAAVIDKDRGPILEANNLRMFFPIKSGLLRRTIGQVQAVDGVSFQVPRGASLGLVGEHLNHFFYGAKPVGQPLVARLIDGAHPAAAHERNDPIARAEDCAGEKPRALTGK